VIALFMGAAALAAFDLHKKDMRGVLGAVGFFVFGLVLGTVLQLVFPGGIFLGGLGGAALGATRFDDFRRSRRQALEEELAATDELAERMLLIHDRLDRARPKQKWTTRISGTVAVTLLSLFAGILLLVGLLHEAGELLLLGGLAAGLPSAAWASKAIRDEDVYFLSRALTACEDEAAGVLDGPPTQHTS